MHAYQSKVFNTVASRRAQKFGRQVLDGDRFNELAEHNTIENVVLPLPCFPLRLPENEGECGLMTSEMQRNKLDFFMETVFYPFHLT